MKEKTNILELTQTKIFLIVLSFLTIVHHISVSQIGKSLYGNELLIFKGIGIFCVGNFMMLMGYEAARTLSGDCSDRIKVYKKRMLMLLFSFFFCNYAYMIVTQIMGVSYTTRELITAFFGIQLLNSHMWIAVELMILYVIYYVIFKLVKSENRVLTVALLTVVSLIIMIFSFSLGHGISRHRITNWFYGEWWYNTTLSFTVGVSYYLFQNEIDRGLERAGKKLCFIIGALFLPMVIFEIHISETYGYWTDLTNPKHYVDKLITVVVQVPTILMAQFLFITILYNLGRKKAKNTVFSEIFLELILCNNIFIFICYNTQYFITKGMFFVLEIVFTYIAAMLIYYFKQLVFKE